LDQSFLELRLLDQAYREQQLRDFAPGTLDLIDSPHLKLDSTPVSDLSLPLQLLDQSLDQRPSDLDISEPCPEGLRYEEQEGSSLEGQILLPCEIHIYRFSAAVESDFEINLRPWADLNEVRLSLTWADVEGEVPALSGARVEALSPTPLRFRAPLSGEYRLLVAGGTQTQAGRYDLEIRCIEGCRQTSRHPILLVHGWTGWSEIGPYTYFYGVKEHLETAGFQVYVASLDPYNSIEIRSEQLAEQLEQFLASAHAERINIIAHSQGGLDSRRLISALDYGGRVASLTTISTPHRGTPLLDVALGLMPGLGEQALAGLLDWLGASVVGSESDAIASFEAMTEEYVQRTFNPAHSDDPQVKYISYAGKTCTLGLSCDDICDLEIQWSYHIILSQAGENDGIVPVESAIWGEYRGEIPADHFDEVGQLAGVTGPNFNHLAFYLDLAQDLIVEGF